MAWCKKLSWHSPGSIDENHKRITWYKFRVKTRTQHISSTSEKRYSLEPTCPLTLCNTDKITTVTWLTTVRLGILKSLNNWVHSTTSSTVSAVPHWDAPSTVCFGSNYCFNIRPMLPKLHTAIRKPPLLRFHFPVPTKTKTLACSALTKQVIDTV